MLPQRRSARIAQRRAAEEQRTGTTRALRPRSVLSHIPMSPSSTSGRQPAGATLVTSRRSNWPQLSTPTQPATGQVETSPPPPGDGSMSGSPAPEIVTKSPGQAVNEVGAFLDIVAQGTSRNTQEVDNIREAISGDKTLSFEDLKRLSLVPSTVWESHRRQLITVYKTKAKNADTEANRDKFLKRAKELFEEAGPAIRPTLPEPSGMQSGALTEEDEEDMVIRQRLYDADFKEKLRLDALDDLRTSMPDYSTVVAGLHFFTRRMEAMYASWKIGGELKLLETIHTENQYLKARTTGRNHPIMWDWEKDDMVKEVLPVFLVYDEALIEACLKGQVSEYFRAEPKPAAIFDGPVEGETENNKKFGRRFENYALLLQDQSGLRFCVKDFRAILRMIRQYIRGVKTLAVDDPDRQEAKRGKRFVPIYRGEQSDDTLALVRKIDNVVRPPTGQEDFSNRQRRYIQTPDNIRILEEWTLFWKGFLDYHQANLGLDDLDEVPKDVTYVGYTIDPVTRMESHLNHRSSATHMDLVDAVALVFSRENYTDGRIVKMRYRTIRLIQHPDIAAVTEHIDSMTFGSYFFQGGVNGDFGGGSNQSAQDLKNQDVYETTNQQIREWGHLEANFERIKRNLEANAYRIEKQQELSEKLDKVFEQWPRMVPDLQKARTVTEQIEERRAAISKEEQEIYRLLVERNTTLDDSIELMDQVTEVVRLPLLVPALLKDDGRMLKEKMDQLDEARAAVTRLPKPSPREDAQTE